MRKVTAGEICRPRSTRARGPRVSVTARGRRMAAWIQGSRAPTPPCAPAQFGCPSASACVLPTAAFRRPMNGHIGEWHDLAY